VTVPIDVQVQCVEREISMRLRVYPKWCEQKRMTQKKADQEIEAMRSVLETLKNIQLTERLI